MDCTAIQKHKIYIAVEITHSCKVLSNLFAISGSAMPIELIVTQHEDIA